MQPPGEEDWRWIDEHVEHPTPEVAGDEVRIVGHEERTLPGADAAAGEERRREPSRTDPDRPAETQQEDR
ncbi:hypothetical protein [Geodermatophilus sp. SYSU D00700]